MSWLARRASQGPEPSAAAAAFAADLARAVDRTFAIDDEALTRVRGVALGAFIEAAPATVGRGRHRPMGRRLALGLAAAVGLLSISVVAVQARPGGPFYGVRLAIETATLGPADAPTGWQARLDRLQRRIDESLAADRAADPGAVGAALDEYRLELADMTTGLTDPAHRSSLVAVVTPHLAIALDLERRDPSDAASSLIAAMEAFLGPTEPDPATTGNPHPDGTTGNPHPDGATGNPHADGATGNPHTGGSTGDPHAGGTTGNPHADGATGNPHANDKPDRPTEPRAKPRPTPGAETNKSGKAGGGR